MIITRVTKTFISFDSKDINLIHPGFTHQEILDYFSGNLHPNTIGFFFMKLNAKKVKWEIFYCEFNEIILVAEVQKIDNNYCPITNFYCEES